MTAEDRLTARIEQTLEKNMNIRESHKHYKFLNYKLILIRNLLRSIIDRIIVHV